MYLIFTDPRLKKHEMFLIKDNIFKCSYWGLEYNKENVINNNWVHAFPLKQCVCVCSMESKQPKHFLMRKTVN